MTLRIASRLSVVGALAALVAGALALSPSRASAGGYDTPMLYSSRHMGMGGAAVGYVNDASSLFHNPAGLGQIGRAHLLVDLSLLVGDLRASPVAGDSARNITSETTIAPAFLLGGALRVHERLTVGLGVFPVAAAGGEYRYVQEDGQDVVDSTSLNFFEFTPALAVNIDEIGLRIGASYRVTYVQLSRRRVPSPNAETPRPNLRIDASGVDFRGFRLGLQYQPPQHPNLQLGLNYRHKTVTTVESSGPVYALGLRLNAVATTRFVLPARLEFGARYDFGTANTNGHYLGAAAFDVIYAFNSQNEEAGFAINSFELVQVFDWSNSVTLRFGGEYRVLDRRMPLRLGYSFDGKTSNPRFPTAFGTPPAATHIMTAGLGYDAGPWELNVAYARRMGSARVTQADLDAGDQQRTDAGLATCSLCGAPGNYAITLNGIYVDFSFDWD